MNTALAAVLFTLALTGAVSCQSTEYPHVKVSYTIWAEEGSNPSAFQASIDVEVHANASLYHVMEHASWADPSIFAFESTVHPEFGHYITCISSRCEHVSANIFWLSYKTEGAPDPASPPADATMLPTGVDTTYVNEGEHYLFWLHKYEWQN